MTEQPGTEPADASTAAETTSRKRHLLSVLIPVFNEESTLEECVCRVAAVQFDDIDTEVILVDDASADGSLALARRLEQAPPAGLARVKVLAWVRHWPPAMFPSVRRPR